MPSGGTVAAAPAPCRFLGALRGVRVKVECPQTTGRTVLADEHLCHCPALARTPGVPRVCVNAWPGPWVLPHQELEAAAFPLCHQCPHRTAPE